MNISYSKQITICKPLVHNSFVESANLEIFFWGERWLFNTYKNKKIYVYISLAINEATYVLEWNLL